MRWCHADWNPLSPFKVGDAVDASLLGNVHRDLTSLVFLSFVFITHTLQ